MSSTDQLQPLDGDGETDAAQALTRAQRRYARERNARLEAESISERVTRELYDKQRDLALIEAVTKAANEASDASGAISRALEAVREYSSWRFGHLWLVNDDGNMASTDVWAGDGARDGAFLAASRGLTFARGQGLPGRSLAEGAPVWVSDPAEIAALPRGAAMTAAGLRTALCFPLLIGDEVVGAMEFVSDQGVSPEEGLLDLMTQVGTQLGRVIERQRAAEQLLYQATHDALTGLPNRVRILEELRRALARRDRREGEEVAVFFIDLDGFKAVNDTLGHAAGDRLLREVARRLASAIRPGDTLGRLAGDEFVIICEALQAERPVVDIAARLIELLGAPFEFEGERFVVSGSVGIALAEGGEEPHELIEQADAAMYRSKEQGRGRYEIFSEALRQRMLERLDRERALRHAVERQELVLHYQPEVDLRTGRIIGVEALVRWQRGDELLLPGKFIGLAEDTGLIVPIGAWALDEALAQLGRWEADPAIADPPWVSVNLSVRQLADPELLATVRSILDDRQTDPGRLLLEVTESVILDDAESGLRVLSALRALGADLAIDDFGTGYASLSYLRRFPASVVKVDRSFVSELDTSERSRAIVEAIVQMGRALDLSLVAEGIETPSQLGVVRELGFDVGQGFHFARPVPAAELDALLRAGTPFAF